MADELWPDGPPSPELIAWSAKAIAAYVDAFPDDPEVARFRRAMGELNDGLT